MATDFLLPLLPKARKLYIVSPMTIVGNLAQGICWCWNVDTVRSVKSRAERRN